MISKKTFGHFVQNFARTIKEIERCDMVEDNARRERSEQCKFLRELLDDLYNDIYNDLPQE